jgi:P27 family predicted phage terminase small subunit
MPPAPGGLQVAGRAAWVRIWRAAPWLVPEADGLLVGLVCSSLDQRATLQAMLDRDGPVIAGTRGTKVLHPAARQLRAIDGQVAGWLRSLGLTPIDRRRMPKVRPATPERAPGGRALAPAYQAGIWASMSKQEQLEKTFAANMAAGRPWWEGTKYEHDEEEEQAEREATT